MQPQANFRRPLIEAPTTWNTCRRLPTVSCIVLCKRASLTNTDAKLLLAICLGAGSDFSLDNKSHPKKETTFPC